MTLMNAAADSADDADMRTYLPDIELRRASSLEEAVALLHEEPGAWIPFAGGTDLMVLMAAGTLPQRRYLSLWGIDELRGVRVAPDAVTLGALTTYTDVLRDPVLGAEFPLMGCAAAETGSVATQNRGTIGGNIANASPAADTPPVLLVYDAEVEIASSRGSRTVPYSAFHTGYKRMDLARDEIITHIRLPRGRRGWRETFRKVGTRGAQAISKVCFAAATDLEGGGVRDVRVAFGSVAPTVVRCRGVEDLLRGRRLDADAIDAAVAALPREIAPIDDVRSTARYRLRVSQNLLRAFLYGPAAPVSR
jgi:CO/xanthine dehydrogenase FAD-binding subunit